MSAVAKDVLPVVTVGEAAVRVMRWWRHTREGTYLGFASRSVLGRVIDEGVTGAGHATDVQPATWMSPADEQIDALVALMPRELALALVEDQKRGKPTKVIVATLGCTPAEFYRRREGGYGWIAGALTAVERRLGPKGR